MSIRTPPSVLLVSGFDSGLKLAGRLADAFESAGASVAIVLSDDRGPRTLSTAQADAATARTVSFGTWSAILEQAMESDVVVPIFDGSRVERFIGDLRGVAAGRSLPVLGAAYVGMVLYESLSGYLRRSLADVIAVNSQRDFRDFSTAARDLGLPTANLLLSGLALLPAKPAPQRQSAIRRVLFADQPTVPARRVQREYLYRRLDEYARRHPDREVIIRPRHRTGETTFHRMTYSPEDFAKLADLAPNFRVDHSPILDLLAETDLLITVSSTAALEAIAAGTRVALVGDFVGESFLNPPLLASGLVRTFDQIDLDEIGTPAEPWLADVFPSSVGTPPADRFATTALALVDSADRPHEAMWNHPFQVSRRRMDASTALDQGTFQARLKRLARAVLRRLR